VRKARTTHEADQPIGRARRDMNLTAGTASDDEDICLTEPPLRDENRGRFLEAVTTDECRSPDDGHLDPCA
jgi:hypothetical protein